MAAKLSSLKLKNVVSVETSDDEKRTGDDLNLSLEKLNLGPRKKLLVLDLNGILVHRVHILDESTIPRKCRPDAFYGKFRVYKRPFCDEFLKFCFDRFEVGLWSSAMDHNIDGVLSTVMGSYRRKLVFVWDQKQCTNSGFGSLEKKEKPIFLKELEKLWEKFRHFLPSNTLLIDDDPCKALLNPPNTAIFPNKYKADNVDDNILGPKGELQHFLDGLADAADVPSYVKNHPFGQPAITPSHPDWDFYSKIVRQFRKEEAAVKKI